MLFFFFFLDNVHVFVLEHTALMVLCARVYFSEDATLALQASFQISPL